MEFGDEGQSLARLTSAVDAARECGFAAVSANDHFLFQAPWLDGPTALAAVIERSGAMELATTVALVALRGPVPPSTQSVASRRSARLRTALIGGRAGRTGAAPRDAAEAPPLLRYAGVH
jgi:hypothetical protein